MTEADTTDTTHIPLTHIHARKQTPTETQIPPTLPLPHNHTHSNHRTPGSLLTSAKLEQHVGQREVHLSKFKTTRTTSTTSYASALLLGSTQVFPCSGESKVWSDSLAADVPQDLLTIAKRLKLKWYGHTSYSSALAKTILQGATSEWRVETGQTEKRGGKTSGNGQAWCSPSPRGQWRTGGNGGNWF